MSPALLPTRYPGYHHHHHNHQHHQQQYICKQNKSGFPERGAVHYLDTGVSFYHLHHRRRYYRYRRCGLLISTGILQQKPTEGRRWSSGPPQPFVPRLSDTLACFIIIITIIIIVIIIIIYSLKLGVSSKGLQKEGFGLAVHLSQLPSGFETHLVRFIIIIVIIIVIIIIYSLKLGFSSKGLQKEGGGVAVHLRQLLPGFETHLVCVVPFFATGVLCEAFGLKG